MSNLINISTQITGPLFSPDFLKNAIKESLENSGAFLLTELVILANNSRNADNQPLQPYSRRTLQLRAMAGIGSTPNFQFTSAMLNSLTILTKNDNSFQIGVVGVDMNGMSNALKLQKTQQIKNYYLLRATPYLSKRVADFFESQILSKLGGV